MSYVYYVVIKHCFIICYFSEFYFYPMPLQTTFDQVAEVGEPNGQYDVT